MRRSGCFEATIASGVNAFRGDSVLTAKFNTWGFRSYGNDRFANVTYKVIHRGWFYNADGGGFGNGVFVINGWSSQGGDVGGFRSYKNDWSTSDYVVGTSIGIDRLGMGLSNTGRFDGCYEMGHVTPSGSAYTYLGFRF
jgi:hypothetical protein